MSTVSSTTAGSTGMTIPNCTATHVIGNTSLPLAAGPLTLLTTPTLTLQIGTRAFPLPSSTPFGTDPANQRIYLFAPAGLESQGGHVRIELPRDISVESHTNFERALIAAGLLVEGDPDQNGSRGGGVSSWFGRKVDGFKGAASGVTAGSGGVPEDAFEDSDDEGKCV